MKRIIFITLLVLGTYNGFSNSFVSLWGGAGLAARYNYDYGLSYGVDYTHAVFYQMGLGLSVFTQQYNLYYDKDSWEMASGAKIRNNSNYVFACPKMEFHLGRQKKKDGSGTKGNIHFYLTGGAGFKMGATDSLHKWARASSTTLVAYDSAVDRSGSMNSMVYRVGFGFTEFLPMKGGHFNFTFGQDFGFLTGLISNSDEPNNIKLHSTITQFYRPAYFTFRIGICYNSH